MTTKQADKKTTKRDVIRAVNEEEDARRADEALPYALPVCDYCGRECDVDGYWPECSTPCRNCGARYCHSFKCINRFPYN